MHLTFEALNRLSTFIFTGLFVTGFLFILSLFLTKSNGLFIARSLKEFQEDENNPNTHEERRIGKKIKYFTFKYITPFFLFFLIMFILLLFLP